MQVVHEVCCGLDVHKKSVTACVLWAAGRRRQTREFGTFTKDLLELADWLRVCGVTQVALESTGVYWKPVWNLLEGQFEVLLVNAQHIKAVPGRKTDQKDCEWIADLLQHGLLRGSFVPPKPLRELRDLTRYRVSLAQECNRIANRIQKVLDDANLKLASVASDPLGASGRAILKAILAGEEDRERLAEMSRGILRNKIPELRLALEGRVTEHHRFLLKQLLEHQEFMEWKVGEAQEIDVVSKSAGILANERTGQVRDGAGHKTRHVEKPVHQLYLLARSRRAGTFRDGLLSLFHRLADGSLNPL